MMARAPAWALTAEAIDGAGDTHLPFGIHVRVLPSPKLGIPATPLLVYRSVLEPSMIKELGRSDGVTWIDSTGAPLTTPFDVTPDDPVYGYFPVPNVFWAELQATPAPGTRLPPVKLGDIRDIGDLLRPGVTLPGPIGPVLPPLVKPRIQPATERPPIVGRFASERESAAFQDRLRELLTRFAFGAGTIRFEALAPSELGPAPFQSRSADPWQLAAWTIPLVRVIGRGTVRGIRWLDASRLREQPKEELWAIWSLPVNPAPRYTPTANAHVEAADRVGRAGATRQPMYVAYTAVSPGSAPAATPADAVGRVGQVQTDMDAWLERLLNDLNAEPADLTDKQAITGRNGSVAVPIEPFVIAGSVDPDVGHYLGFGDVDQKPPQQGSLVLYRIRGLWRWRPRRWVGAQLPAFGPAARKDLEQVVGSFPDLEAKGLLPKEEGPFVDLDTLAVTVAGLPPDAPPPISFDAADDRGWLATPPPPDVRRALRLRASGFRPHVMAALAATDSRGDRTLHPFPRSGRIVVGGVSPAGTPLPLAVTRPVDATRPGEGRFEDRDAPEGAVLYRLAEGDWFGRWSEWRTRSAPAKARTAPMRPTIEIYPQPPSFDPPPIVDGLFHGTIQLRIPIPRTADLPPGGAELARLDLVETFEGSPATIVPVSLSGPFPATIETHAPPAEDLLIITRPGPDLPRCGSRKVTYTARWIDVLGLVSADADPASRTMVDPRPPAPPPVITELRWTSRPDAMGHARVDLDFGSTVGTRYRVFGANETSLLRALELSGQTAARADILAAAPGAPRAERFRAHRALFGWDHFEPLTKEPILATSTTTHFVHRVSGSLEVLAIYRVLGEGPSGALSEMTQADIVPFAVPNLGPTARPQVAIVNAGLDPTTQGVRLRVKVPVGRASPKAWRLRRSGSPATDPLAMGLVDSGLVTTPTVDSQGTTFEINAAAPLRAWRRYGFAVEVQANDPPGSPTVGVILPGAWSAASAIITVAVIPPLAPAAPSAVAIANVVAGLQISVSHPAAATLVGTALGPHRFEVWRVEPGGRPAKRDIAFVQAGGTWVGTDPGVAPPGTYVTVQIADPMGRASDGTASNQL